MTRFDDDLQRGCSGPRPEEQEPPLVQCPRCGGAAYDLGQEFDCENCGVFVVGGDDGYL